MRKTVALIFSVSMGMLAGPASAAPDTAGPPGGLATNIVNPLPLPVTGDVSINYDACSREPFFWGDTVDSDSSDSVTYAFWSNAVPEGKVMVIETVSVETFTRTDNDPVSLYLGTGGGSCPDSCPFLMALPLTRQGEISAGYQFSASTVSGRLVYDSSDPIWIRLSTQEADDFSRMSTAVHGYFTGADCPQP